MADADEVLNPLRQQRELLKEREDTSARALDVSRTAFANSTQLCQGMAAAIGLTDSLVRVLSASARDVAAMEASFAAAVDAREAIDALIEEITDLADAS